MPSYFFDVKDADGVHRDEVGLDLPDMEAAVTEGKRALAEMTREAAEDHAKDQVIEILIRDHGEGPVRLVMSVTTERGPG